MLHLEPEVGPPAVTFIASLLATVSGMALIFGLPGTYSTAGIGGSLSRTHSGHLFAIGVIALPLLIMLGSFFFG